MTDTPAAAVSPRSLADDLAGRVAAAAAAVAPDGGALHEPEFEGNEKAYVLDCIESGWVSSVGRYVDRFEDMLRDVSGAGHAVATVNGTAALHVALHLAGVRPGDEVLTPAFGFVAVANAVSQCAAVPHFVEVEEATLALDPAALDAHLAATLVTRDGVPVNRATGRPVRALLVAHILGHPADLPGALVVAAKYDLPVIEDAAESLGSLREGRHTGTFGLIGAFSFNGNKTVTTGGGGAVVTGDPAVGARAKHLTTTAKRPHAWEFDHDAVAFNYRMPNLNAALGCAQLERLDDFVARKRRLAEIYRAAFSGVEGVQFVAEPAGTRSNYWLNAILLEADDRDARDAIHRACHDRGIMTRSAWVPLNRLAMYAACPSMPTPVADSLYRRLVKLPSSPALADRHGGDA